MKTVSLVCLFVAGTSAIVHIFDYGLKPDVNYQIKYVPNSKFSFEFMTEADQLVFKVASAEGRKLAFYRTNNTKSIIPKFKFKRGTENTLQLAVTGDNTVKVNGINFETKIPLSKVAKVIGTGLLKKPVYLASMTGPGWYHEK